MGIERIEYGDRIVIDADLIAVILADHWDRAD